MLFDLDVSTFISALDLAYGNREIKDLNGNRERRDDVEGHPTKTDIRQAERSHGFRHFNLALVFERDMTDFYGVRLMKMGNAPVLLVEAELPNPELVVIAQESVLHGSEKVCFSVSVEANLSSVKGVSEI